MSTSKKKPAVKAKSAPKASSRQQKSAPKATSKDLKPQAKASKPSPKETAKAKTKKAAAAPAIAKKNNASAKAITATAGKNKAETQTNKKATKPATATAVKKVVAKVSPTAAKSKVSAPAKSTAKGSSAKAPAPAPKTSTKIKPPSKSKDVGSQLEAKKPSVATNNPKIVEKVEKEQPVVRKPVHGVAPPSKTDPKIVAKIRSAQAEKENRKDLAQPAPVTTLTPLTTLPPVEKGKDRIILMVRDPYWLHAHWDITRAAVERAKAALAEYWHTVKPILRLLTLDDSGTTSNSETIYRDVEIHGGVRNWYIDVNIPQGRFKILMGYLTSNGRFYELARSNTVTTPVPGGKEPSDDHWADIAKDAERIYAMSGGYGDETQSGELAEVFEEKLKRTMESDVLSQFGSGAEGSLKRNRQFHFDIDAELIVFGSTHPDAHVSIGPEPVKVRTDGTFSLRMPLPDKRQVLPATAKSRDGVDEQTVVIAVERNTKVMEPLSMESDDA